MQGALYGSLVRLLLSEATFTDVYRRAAAVLAVATFILHSYPGGEQPSHSYVCNRAERARQTLRSHMENYGLGLGGHFAFGFVGVLPYIHPDVLSAHTKYERKLLSEFLNSVNWFNWEGLSTLPTGCPIDGHLTTLDASATTQDTTLQTPPESPAWSAALLAMHGLDWYAPEMYVPALAALCSTSSEQLQKLCVRVLDLQPVVIDFVQIIRLESLMCENLVRRIQSTDPRTTRAATLYFRLMAATLMLSSVLSLADRVRVLGNSQEDYCRNNLLELSPQDAHLLDMRSILDHVAENTDSQSYSDARDQTMQLIVNFRHVHSSSCELLPAMRSDSVDCVKELEEIRRTRRPVAEEAQLVPNVETGHAPTGEWLPIVEQCGHDEFVHTLDEAYVEEQSAAGTDELP